MRTRIPGEWNIVYINSIENYSRISVISSIRRLYSRILKQRITKKNEEIEEQNEFPTRRL